jgi:hypothetical protein
MWGSIRWSRPTCNGGSRFNEQVQSNYMFVGDTHDFDNHTGPESGCPGCWSRLLRLLLLPDLWVSLIPPPPGMPDQIGPLRASYPLEVGDPATNLPVLPSYLMTISVSRPLNVTLVLFPRISAMKVSLANADPSQTSMLGNGVMWCN